MKFLVFATLVLTSSVGANNIESEAQEAWLTSVHESWAEQDSEFKNSPTSPLAGASRFELDETGVVYFAEKRVRIRHQVLICWLETFSRPAGFRLQFTPMKIRSLHWYLMQTVNKSKISIRLRGSNPTPGSL